MNNFFLLLKLIFQNYSVLRTLQIIKLKKSNLKGRTVEFGASKEKNKNFSNLIKEKKKLEFSNIFMDKKLKIFYADLTKKLLIKSNSYQNILIFNVLEHLKSHNTTLLEMNRILKKKGALVGSTPFLYQVHGAPKDYLRFTKDYLEFIFKKSKFKDVQITNLGYGPFVACYSLLQSYLKYLPIFTQIILLICFIFDTFIQLFVKTDLKEIYPIGLFFKIRK